MRWFLLFPFALWATVNEPLQLKLLTGYRNDHIQGRENLNAQFWENDLSLKVVHRDLTFFAQGGGSALGPGWALDGTGYFGYAVNLTADRLYLVTVTPLAGFSGHYEQINTYRQTWYGPYIGGGIYIYPGRHLSFEVGYAYHWLHLRVHADHTKMKTSGNHGHSGWAEMEWRVHKFWRLGAASQIEYYFSNESFKLRFTSISVLFTISRQL